MKVFGQYRLVLLIFLFVIALFVYRHYTSTVACTLPKIQHYPQQTERSSPPRTTELPTPDPPIVTQSAPSPPQSSDDYKKFLKRLADKIFSPTLVDGEDEKYTLVIQTYRRVKVLTRLLQHYCKLEKIDKIIVLWNDVQTPVPDELRSVHCSTRLVISREKENKMTNRFKERKDIETDAVLIIDDDRWVELNDILLLFQTWKQFRHRIVGFEHRMHSTRPNGSLHYGPGWKWGDTPDKLGYSMMITPQCFFHRVYLTLFNTPQFTPHQVLDYIDQSMNCDDIAINFVASKFLNEVSWPQSAALSVVPRYKIKNLEGQSGGYRGLSVTRPKHYLTRSFCLNLFTKYFKGFPLHYTKSGITDRF